MNTPIEIISKYLDLSIVVFSTSLGIGFSAFTLLYSFIISKKESLKDIKEEITSKGDSVTLLRKRNNAIGYIDLLKEINKTIIILIIASFMSLIFSISSKLAIERILNEYYKFIYLTLAILTLTITTLLVFIFVKMLIRYNNSTKIK